jgi:subtilisin family serine protease
MRRIRATADGSHAVQRGSHEVLVGIIDTGIDARHPDLRRNLSRRLSRNFTTDIPIIDGPCGEERDGSCADAPTVDEAGHGTHVAGIVAADLNGLGMAGVAPNLRLVNLRAGQDSGYFFLQETVDALTYAGDAGIDVVNMSFYIDPWLYNCPANHADAREARREQRIVVEATQRALDYAHEHGVTLVAGAGNAFTDLGRPRTDHSSPGYPPGAAYHRDIDNSCLVMPVEGRHVVVVNAIGPSGRKAYYSNYGREQSDLSAPGGDLYERFGTRRWQSRDNLILSTYPERVLRDAGLVRPNGRPSNAAVVRDCEGEQCGYYAYLQGTSMASPHVAGVAALIVSERGRADPPRRGLTLRPRAVRRVLVRTANARACPRPRRFDYPGLGPVYSARCAGTRTFNGFYGSGVVNALAAVRARAGREHR